MSEAIERDVRNAETSGIQANNGGKSVGAKVLRCATVQSQCGQVQKLEI